jgi:hypothetical protein
LSSRSRGRALSPSVRRATPTRKPKVSAAARIVVGPDTGIGRIPPDLFYPVPHEFRIQVRRPDDHLVFDLVFENLKVVSGDGAEPKLVRENANAAAYIIVEFPPQSFGEQAFLEVSNADANAGKEVSSDPNYPKKNVPKPGETVPQLPSARVRMAGRSRVVVSMPKSETELPYSLAGVLSALKTWPMRLNINAAPDSEPRRPGVVDAFTFNRAWLKSATESETWASMQKNLAAALGELGAAGAQREIQASAQRLANNAASMLARGRQAPGQARAMQSELARISRRYPQLARGTGQKVSIAALSLAATKAFAASRSRFEVDVGSVAYVPFLPVLFAPHEPPKNVTALELPYRLIISPLAPARWLHSDKPVEHNGRTELWHTRLTTAKQDFGRDEPSKIRALWSPDYPFSEDQIFSILNPPAPFRMSLDPLDRKMLVKLMAGFTEKTADQKTFVPRASQAKRLHLSSLGALLDSEGNWKPRPKGVDLEQWVHQATTGRDHYVRVVYAGYLCPFGHAASLIKVTERKFESLGGNPAKRVAVLRQRFFIVVREHLRQYAGKDHEYKGNNFPFTKVEILTKVTPNLMEPGVDDSELKKVGNNTIYGVNGIVKRMVFWPMVFAATGSADFKFEFATTDISGKRTTFSMPLLFVGEVANDVGIDPIKLAYNDKGVVLRRRADLGSATVCYAPFDPADKGDPRLPTSTMTFRAGNLKVHYHLEPNYYPETEAAQVGIKAVQKLLGQSNAVAEVTYPKVYKEHRFGELDASKNPGKVFLQLINQAHSLEFGESTNQAKSDALGALASPQMAIQGLSKIMGPVAAKLPSDPTDPAKIEDALKNVIGNKFDPTDFFKGAKILGGVDLADILVVVNTLVGGDVPKMLSRELPDKVEASFEWETEIKKSDPLGLIIPKADPNKPQTKLKMRGVMTTPLKNPADTDYQATASLDNFKVNLFGFVIIWFEDLKFVAKKGQKPDVTVNLRQGDDAIQFGGPLEFVNELRNLIPSNGFSDPPNIAVTPSGISASYSLNLPAVGVGIFTLSGVSLGAGFNLPFDSKPASVKFNFSERQSPFSLTVSMLGGGGFFAIGISSRGVQEIEAALEFGAGVAIDLGVASGSVEIKAGVYFHWLEPVPDKGSIDLAGYVRLHGELCILGIISASLTFNLQLAYHKEAGKSNVWGEATLVIEIEILFFSADVSVRCRREFAGSESDPKFKDLIPDQGTWDEYCSAFALEAA